MLMCLAVTTNIQVFVIGSQNCTEALKHPTLQNKIILHNGTICGNVTDKLYVFLQSNAYCIAMQTMRHNYKSMGHHNITFSP